MNSNIAWFPSSHWAALGGQKKEGEGANFANLFA